MVQTSSLLADTLFYVKDFLDGDITDPLSSTRPGQEKFIMTSYPTRPVRYPLITIKDMGSFDLGALGFQSEASMFYIDVEIRVWGRNVSERDKIAQQVYNDLKANQIGVSGTSQANNLHDLKLISMVNVDEDAVKSKVMTFRFLFVAT